MAALYLERDATQRVDRGRALAVLTFQIARFNDYPADSGVDRSGDFGFLCRHLSVYSSRNVFQLFPGRTNIGFLTRTNY